MLFGLFRRAKRPVAPMAWPAALCLRGRHARAVANIFYIHAVAVICHWHRFSVVFCLSLHFGRSRPEFTGRSPAFVFVPFVHVRLNRCAL